MAFCLLHFLSQKKTSTYALGLNLKDKDRITKEREEKRKAKKAFGVCSIVLLFLSCIGRPDFRFLFPLLCDEVVGSVSLGLAATYCNASCMVKGRIYNYPHPGMWHPLENLLGYLQSLQQRRESRCIVIHHNISSSILHTQSIQF